MALTRKDVGARLIWAFAGFGIAACAAEIDAVPDVVASRANSCEIVRVVDGDTVDISCGGVADRVRLIGFDTPESFRAQCRSEQRRAFAATQYLSVQIAQAGDIAFGFQGRDRYDRRLAVMRLDGRDVARIMVAAGHARVYDGGRRQGWCG